MKFIDLFSGIGGFRMGMEMAGHECIGHCEIDKFANKSYIEIHNPKEGEWFAENIKTVRPEDIPRSDAWCFGFPCQDVSVAGKKTGLTGERSGLFYTVIDLVKGQEKKNKPSILFIENVKNLLSVNGGWDFANILAEMDEAGYDAEWQIINSSWYLPQHRERIYIIGHLRGRCTKKVFPITGKNRESIKLLIAGCQSSRLYDSNGLSACITTSGSSHGLYLITERSEEIDSMRDDAQACLTPGRLVKRQNGRRFKESGEPMFTITAQDIHGIRIDNFIRRLTPRECFRLQGFPDWAFDRAAAVNSDTQLYKQAGNSVSVPAIYEIAKKLEVDKRLN